MTIRTKVRVGLALILAIFVALSGFAIDRISTMARHWSGLTDTVMPTLTLSGEMGSVLDQLRVLEAYHILEQDADRMRVLRISIEKLQARMYGLVAEYKEIATVPAERAALDALAIDLRAYVQASDELHLRSEANNTSEAFRLLQLSQPIHARLAQHISTLDEITQLLADQAAASGLDVAEQAKTGAIAGVIVLAAIMLILIVASNRNVLSPIRQLIGTIDQLADGKLATEIPYPARKDELGDVARALVHFRDNSVEKERLQKQEKDDLEFARRVQLTSVPRRFPAFPDRPEIDLAGHLAPTRAVGGDFYDFHFVGPDRLALSLGDASGKGVASAMFVGMARSALKLESTKTADPGECLSEANRIISADNETMMFMTTFMGFLDVRTGELVYANAGHLPPYLIGAGGVRAEALEPGVPLGVMDDYVFDAKSVRLAPGDALMLYSDGVTEAADLEGNLFGETRLEAVLTTQTGRSCAEIVAAVLDAVRRFAGTAPQADDIAILVVQYKGPA
jgi:serine phosphatase RsbU (regulator of sigma subunit)